MGCHGIGPGLSLSRSSFPTGRVLEFCPDLNGTVRCSAVQCSAPWNSRNGLGEFCEPIVHISLSCHGLLEPDRISRQASVSLLRAWKFLPVSPCVICGRSSHLSRGRGPCELRLMSFSGELAFEALLPSRDRPTLGVGTAAQTELRSLPSLFFSSARFPFSLCPPAVMNRKDCSFNAGGDPCLPRRRRRL